MKRLLPFIFADYGSGEQLAFQDISSGSADFFGAGLGIQYQYKTYFQTYITWGYPISQTLPAGLENKEEYDPVIYAMLKMSY